MGLVCGAYVGVEGAYMFLVRKPEAKRPLGTPRHRWLNNIRMDRLEVACGFVD